MLVNDLVALLMKIPPLLAGAWGVWFFVGLLLSIWQRKEHAMLVVHTAPPKQKSGVRPPRPPARSVPLPGGDAFGELEAMLEPPTTGLHRRPGDN